MSTDPQVTHPSHYTAHPIIAGECWGYAYALDNGAEFSAFKYFFRNGGKGNALQDVEKGIWYLQQIIDNEDLQPVLQAGYMSDGKDLQQAMTHRRYDAMYRLLLDIDLEKYARAQRAQQLSVQVCRLIITGVDISEALDTAEQVRDLIAKEQQMVYDNKVALRREEQGSTTAELGMVYPALTLPHGAVWRKPGSASTMHVGRVKVTHAGANSGNVSGHTPGGRGTHTRAAIDHLINVLDLAKGIEAGSSITLNINTGTEKNDPELHHIDNIVTTDGVDVKPYSDVQVAVWGIQYALLLDHDNMHGRFLRELHTYRLEIS